MRNRIIIFSICIAVISSSISFSQQKIIFEQLSVPDGLSSNNITGVCQDDYGDLWIGTMSGLHRLDPKTGSFSRVPSLETRRYSSDVAILLEKAVVRGNPLASILEVPDFANETEDFSISKKTDVVIISAGEGLLAWDMFDFGWLENAAGELWRKDTTPDDDVTLMVIKAR